MGCPSSCASAAIGAPTSAKVETTRRGVIVKPSRCAVRPRRRSSGGFGLKASPSWASATNAASSRCSAYCSASVRTRAGLSRTRPRKVSSTSRPRRRRARGRSSRGARWSTPSWLQATMPIPRAIASMPRTLESSRPLSTMRSAATRADRSATSSRTRLLSRVGLPAMKRARPPGWLVPSSMRPRASSSKCRRVLRPPRAASSARQRSHVGAATFMGSTRGSPTLIDEGCGPPFTVAGSSIS